METLNYVVRRIIAWPVVLIGTLLVSIGGGLILFGAWAIDMDVSDIKS